MDPSQELQQENRQLKEELQQFFGILTYHVYAFTFEKLPRLVDRNFCLAIT